jgi:hypothetical protein
MKRWEGRPRAQYRRRYLSADTHRRIRQAATDGVSLALIARSMGLGYSTVTHIVYGTRTPRRGAAGAAVKGTARGTRPVPCFVPAAVAQ